MKYAPTALLLTLLFGAGFLCGYHGREQPPAPGGNSGQATATGTGKKARNSVAPGTARAGSADTQPVAADHTPTPRQRLQVLATIGRQKNHFGGEYKCSPINRFDADPLSPEFIHVFDLNQEEAGRIRQSLIEARERMLALQRAAARVQFDPETSSLAIEIPALPREGGSIYDQTNSNLRKVLGSEREAYFDLFCAELFERSFDGFGLQAKTASMRPNKDTRWKQPYLLKIQGKDYEWTMPMSMPQGSSKSGEPLIDELIQKYYGK